MLKFFIPVLCCCTLLAACGSKSSDKPADTQAPVATLSAGAVTQNGNTFSVQLTMSATDNVGVTYTELDSNNVLLAQNPTSPYTATLQANTTYNFVFKAKDAAGNVGTSSTVTVTTPSLIKPSSTLLQPIIAVSSFRALQLNACSNQDFTVSFSTSTAARTLQSATFTLTGDGAGAYRSLRYRPAGDFTTAWKQIDFSGNSVTVPFSVLIPAGITAKYDLKVCTKSSVSGIANGANTSMAISAVSTDEVGVNAPTGSAFQAAVALPALDLVTAATVITSTINAGRDASQLILSANQTRSQYVIGQFANIKASGPSGMTFSGVTLKNIYGNSNLSVTGNWSGTVFDANTPGVYNLIQQTMQNNGDYYYILFSGGILQNNGDYNQCGITANIKAGPSGFTSESTGFGFSLRSKWDVIFQNSNGNDVNLTDNTVQDNGTTLSN